MVRCVVLYLPRRTRVDERNSRTTGTGVRLLTMSRGSGTARRLMVVRLRVRIARLEAQQPSDPGLAQARRELRALTGAAQDND